MTLFVRIRRTPSNTDMPAQYWSVVNKENSMSLIVEGVAVPDSKLAREITEVVRDTVTPLLFHHSSRVYYFGALVVWREYTLVEYFERCLQQWRPGALEDHCALCWIGRGQRPLVRTARQRRHVSHC
jgi:hypothetical protein